MQQKLYAFAAFFINHYYKKLISNLTSFCRVYSIKGRKLDIIKRISDGN